MSHMRVYFTFTCFDIFALFNVIVSSSLSATGRCAILWLTRLSYLILSFLPFMFNRDGFSVLRCKDTVLFIPMIVCVVKSLMLNIFGAETFALRTLVSASVIANLAIVIFVMRSSILLNNNVARLSLVDGIEVLVREALFGSQTFPGPFLNVVADLADSICFTDILALMFLIANMIGEVVRFSFFRFINHVINVVFYDKIIVHMIWEDTLSIAQCTFMNAHRFSACMLIVRGSPFELAYSCAEIVLALHLAKMLVSTVMIF